MKRAATTSATIAVAMLACVAGAGIPTTAWGNCLGHALPASPAGAVDLFGPPNALPLGASPNDVDAADLDADGWLDLITNTHTILNTGDGAFGDAAPHGGAGKAVAVGDLNGDGHLDLVIGNAFSGANDDVTVLLGDGQGAFVGNAPAESSAPQSVALGDLDADGDLDVVTLTDTYMNVGDGTFEAAVPHAKMKRSVHLADLDGDGYPDLVGDDREYTTSPALLSVVIQRNDGTGAFGSPTVYHGTPPTVHGCNWPDGFVELGDFNGDGDTDIIAVRAFSDGCIDGGSWNVADLFVNRGDGSFDMLTQAETGLGWAGWPKAVDVADLDGNGVDDLVIAYQDTGLTFSSYVLAFLIDENGIASTSWSYAPGFQPATVTAADLTGNGRADLVVSDRASEIAEMLSNTINATCAADFDGTDEVGFSDLTELLAKWGGCPNCAEDLDGNGEVGFADLTALLSSWGPCAV